MAELTYDPEGHRNPSLEPGKRYSAVSDGRGAWRLSCGDQTIRVETGDLIRSRNKSKPKLKAGAKHVNYEFTMLRRSYDERAVGTSYTAWFVHFRNTLHFLAGKGHTDDEVFAQDYLSEPRSWHIQRRRIKRPRGLHRFRTAANELAVHLTYKRIKWQRRAPAKPSEAMTRYVQSLFNEFRCTLPRARQRWFPSAAT